MHLGPFLHSWACWSENEVCSGTLLVHGYFEATEIDYTIDQLEPGLKSIVQCFFCCLKSALVICAYQRVHSTRILYLLHTEFICYLWWKISIWSITKFHLNTLLYTLCWQWQRSNVFCKSSQGFHTLLLVFWPIPPCRSPLEQWCFEAVAGQHGLSTPSKDFLWGWDLETG